MTDKPYAVVTFLPNNEDTEPTSDVIPTCWLLATDTKAYWPNFPKRGTTDKRSKLILSLAEPDKSWPTYDVKFCHSYDTYNKARKAANIQNEEDRTVGTEISDIDQRRKIRRNPKYFTESSGDECDVHNDKRSNTVNQLSSDNENEEDLKVKVAALLLKKNNRKQKISQDKEVSMLTSNNLTKTIDSKKDRLVLNNTKESHSCFKQTYQLENASSHTSEAITSTSSSSTSSSPFHRQYDDEDKVKEQLLSENNSQQSESVLFSPVKQIVQENSRQKINTATDNENQTSSQKLNQPTYLSNEQRKRITSVKDQPTGIQSGTQFKENRSYDANCNNLLKKSVSSSNHRSSDNTTAAAINQVKTELLQEISSKLDFVMMNTTKILTYLSPEESLLLRPDNLPALPLNTIDEYEKFEEFLNNGTSFSTVIQYFAGRTLSQGNDWQSAVYLVSKLLISNKLARAISWGGTKDTKIALANSKIMEAVYCAVLKNHPKSDLKTVKSKIQRWLYTGNQRKI